MDSPRATVTVELTLRVGEEPIAGELRASGESRPFVGWIALVRSIEDAMAPVASSEAPNRPSSRTGGS